MMITDKINFKQPKYVLPAILYPLLLISGYLIFDIFDTEPAETGNTLQTTEFLNPELPQARVDRYIAVQYIYLLLGIRYHHPCCPDA